jgi:hypothetical protein
VGEVECHGSSLVTVASVAIREAQVRKPPGEGSSVMEGPEPNLDWIGGQRSGGLRLLHPHPGPSSPGSEAFILSTEHRPRSGTSL